MLLATVQDCALLTPFLQSVFDYGCVVVFTSNRAPHELYERGVNREQFLPVLLQKFEMLGVEVVGLGVTAG